MLSKAMLGTKEIIATCNIKNYDNKKHRIQLSMEEFINCVEPIKINHVRVH
ncbi:hypothetical protein LINPERHAP1_LOCUS23036 [Linum perenne]